MPLLFPAEAPTASVQSVVDSIPKTVSPGAPHYVIFFASPSEASGWRSWCGDCRAVEETLARAVPDRQSTLVYVGQRDEWRDPKNAFKQAFAISRVPTIVRVDSLGGDAVKAIAEGPRLWEAQLLEKETMSTVMGLQI